MWASCKFNFVVQSFCCSGGLFPFGLINFLSDTWLILVLRNLLGHELKVCFMTENVLLFLIDAQKRLKFVSWLEAPGPRKSVNLYSTENRLVIMNFQGTTIQWRPGSKSFLFAVFVSGTHTHTHHPSLERCGLSRAFLVLCSSLNDSFHHIW